MVRVDFSRPEIPELRQRHFVADMHFHTSHSHDCRTPVKDIVARARKLGIHVAITDHNVIGGVLEARNYKDAPIIPGIEICSRQGKEVIAYFSDDKALERFYDTKLAPRLKDKNALRSARTPFTFEELLAMLKPEPCLIHLPHPFAPLHRKSYHFLNRRKRRHLLGILDSIEVLNGQEHRRANLSALGWAVQLGKGIAGGSDGHFLSALGRTVTVSDAKTVKGHLEKVRKGEVRVIGHELKPHERVWTYARTTVRNKVQKGVSGGIKKAAGLPRKALRL